MLFTIDKARDPAVGADQRVDFDSVSAIETPAPDTIVLRLSRPAPFLPQALAHLGIGIDQAHQRTNGRCVDEVVDAAKSVGRGIDGRAARRLVGDVAFDGSRFGSCFLRRAHQTVLAPREQGDAMATLAKTNSDAAPQSARRANYHCSRHTALIGRR